MTKRSRQAVSGNLRIIAGKWRSRRLTFPAVVGLRPTQDRIRETLFNWLAPVIEGAVCLDLFAGSGALGFEALSRGASWVTFVEQDNVVVQAISENCQLLQADNAEVVPGVCPKRMPTLVHAPYNIVFLDPPFHQALIEPAIGWLLANQYLAQGAYIYLEAEHGLQSPAVPTSWSCYRYKQTASLNYWLFESN